MAARTEDYLTESPAEEDYWIAAVEFSDSVGVDIISSSLGYHGFDDKTLNYCYSDLKWKNCGYITSCITFSRQGHDSC